MKTILHLILVIVLTFTTPSYAQALDVKQVADGIVTNMMNQQNIPGVAVAIYDQGHAYLFNYGVADNQTQAPVTSDTIFELASITKIFTTSALSVLVQQNKINLNDYIVLYLPMLATTHGLPIDKVKVLDLATHTAGFPRDITGFGASKEDEPGFMQDLTGWQPSTAIGSHYLYSNVGFGLLGKVLENASGEDYQTLITTNILSPLGMTNTFVSVPPAKEMYQAQGYGPRGMSVPAYTPGFLYGGGALRSSAKDMLAFMEANLGVKPNVPLTLQTVLLNAQKGYFQVKPTFTMALGWQRMTKTGNLLITKNGMNQGYNTFVGFAPNQKVGVVVLTNKRDGEATKMGNQILQQLLNLN